MRIHLLLAAILLIGAAHCFSFKNFRAPECHECVYNFHLLALTWPPQFCSSSSCDPNWQNMWDKKTMTVHGFWPSSTDRAFLTCQKNNNNSYDPYCYHPYAFNFSLLNKTEQDGIASVWPQLGAKKDLWSHQWLKHGTCYLHITEDVIHSQMAQFQVFRTYFLGTVAKAKTINIRLTPGQVANKDALASMIGRKASEFQAICSSGHYLSQIRVCYQITTEPGRESVISCPAFSQECSFPIIVR